jgi:hypothetical protein
MAVFKKSDAVAASKPSITSDDAGTVVAVPFSFVPSAALLVGEILGLAILPPDCMPVDIYLALPDVDTAATGVYDIGFYKATSTSEKIANITDTANLTAVDSNAMVAALTPAGAAVITRATSRDFLDMVVDKLNDRVAAITVTTAPTTGTSATAIKGWFSYRPA